MLMTDKTVTIKGATDEELDKVLWRLRRERETQQIIQDLRQNSADLVVRPRNGSPSYYDNNVSTETPIDQLYHHGILGMKWGVRKDPKTGKKKKGAKKKPEPKSEKKSSRELSEDYLQKIRARNKPLSEMSNAELRAFNDRMNLERTYKQLTAKQPNKYSKIAVEILGGAAKGVAQEFIKSYMKQGLSQLTGSNIDEKKKK